MSNLDRDLILMEELGYGVHYGRYKADHPGEIVVEPVAVEEPEPEPEEKYRTDTQCMNCGKMFRKYNAQHRYCSGACRDEAGNRRYLANYHARKKPIAPRICPLCGEEFTPPHKAQKYCSKSCQRKAKYRSNKKLTTGGNEHEGNGNC